MRLQKIIKFKNFLLVTLIAAAFQPLAANAQYPERKTTNNISKNGLPCIPEICIGDSIEDLKIQLEPVGSLAGKLAINVRVDQASSDKRISKSQFYNEIDKTVKLIEAYQSEEGLISIIDFAKKIDGGSRDALVSNAIWIALAANEIEKNKPKNKTNYAKLINYLTPISPPLQPTKDITTFQKAPRQFDSDFYGTIKNEKITFCYPYKMGALFKSKSGHLTIVNAEPDIDGVYKVSSVSRKIYVEDSRSRADLRKEMLEMYKEFFHSDPQIPSLVSIDGFTGMLRSEISSKNYIDFAIAHPKNFLVNNSYDPDNFDRWNKGWLALKNKNKFVSLESLFQAQPQCRSSKASMN